MGPIDRQSAPACLAPPVAAETWLTARDRLPDHQEQAGICTQCLASVGQVGQVDSNAVDGSLLEGDLNL